MTTRRKAVFIGLCVLVPILIYFGAAMQAFLRANRFRAQWKDEVLARLAKISNEDPEIMASVKSLETTKEHIGDHRAWTNDKVILMKDGEWIAYEFLHGGGPTNHLFLGKTSDGRWLFSTFHFCNGLSMLLGQDAPQSIYEFKQKYFAQEFDGKSDVCLQRTWSHPQ